MIHFKNIMSCSNKLSKTSVLLASMLITGSLAIAQDPVIGPQIRIDVNGGVEAANETTMSSISPDGLEIVAGWNDWRESSFSEIIRAGVAISNDGGNTWTDFLFRAPSGHQSTVEGDPMTCYDSRTGTLWAGAMSWTSSGGVYVARKRPGMNTFDPAVMTYVYGGIDKGWMAAGVDPDDPNKTRVYVSYNLGNQYSADMGDTWSSPQSLGYGIGFLPRVGPNGELYIAYWDFSNGVMLKRSFDGGLSFDPAIRIATRMDVWSTQDGSRFPGSFRVPSMNYLAVDPNSGTLYCVYFDTTEKIGINSNVDLYFTKSTDQGTSWSIPRVINTDSDPAGDQFFPWLEVDDQGRLHMLFYDSRHTVQNDNTAHGMFDAYYSYSLDGGDTWTENRLTPVSFDSYYDGLDRGSSQFLGDYNGLAIGGNKVYPCYLSTQNGDSDIFTHVIEFPSPELIMNDPIPGIAGEDNMFQVDGATPFETVYIVYSLLRGETKVPGCPGLVVKMQNAKIAANGSADLDGMYRVVLLVPPAASGKQVLFQAVQHSNCTVSNLLPFTFK